MREDGERAGGQMGGPEGGTGGGGGPEGGRTATGEENTATFKNTIFTHL